MKVIKDLAMNRTGIRMASHRPYQALVSENEISSKTSEETKSHLTLLRNAYIQEAEQVGLGSIPSPTSIKGLYAAGAQKFKGKEPEIFLDKLGERLAFERTGIRLYDALIGKLETSRTHAAVLPKGTLHYLNKFRNEEAKHFELIRQCMENVGADPTALTPSADCNGVASQGLLQVVTDPRTSFAQSVQAILIAELTDLDGWALLLHLASAMEFKEMAQAFQNALTEEQKHLDHIRSLYEHLVLTEAKVVD